jgi:hypothetical protein
MLSPRRHGRVGGERTCATTVNPRIQRVQLSIGDASPRLDGRARVSAHNSIYLRTSATTPTSTETKILTDLKI